MSPFGRVLFTVFCFLALLTAIAGTLVCLAIPSGHNAIGVGAGYIARTYVFWFSFWTAIGFLILAGAGHIFRVHQGVCPGCGRVRW